MTDNVKVTRRKLADYTHDPFNPNEGTDEGRAIVEHSITELGAGRSAVASSDNGIVAGNKTLDAARAAGITDVIEVETDGDALVVVKRADWTGVDDPEARRYAYLDNRAGELGLKWDPVQIAADHARGIDLSEIFDKETLSQLLHRARRRQQPRREDRPETKPELADKWGTRHGQLWQLGEHQLAVGNCTDIPLLTRLAERGAANLLFTSPPYWVGKPYEQETSRDEISAFISACADAWQTVLSRRYGRVIINTGTCSIHHIEKNIPVEVLPLIDYWQAAFASHGWLLRHMRMWIKSAELAAARVTPRNDVVSSGQFEYLMDFQADVFEHNLVFYSPDDPQRGQNRLNEPWAQLAVWTDLSGDRSAGGHVAAYPRDLPARYIRLYTTTDEIVFDPFGGSGTTLLVCQELGRRCITTELDPDYAALIIDRFVEETGATPMCEGEPVHPRSP